MDAVYLVFWAFALLTCGSALVVTFSTKLIHSVFALFFSLFGVAGLYVILGADFLAAAQVILYIGGIVVLMIFGVMLTNRFAGQGHAPNAFTNVAPAILVCGGVFFLLFTSGVRMEAFDPAWKSTYATVTELDPKTGTRHLPLRASSMNPETRTVEMLPIRGTTLPIGQALMTTHLLSFELASVVLLVAMIGAASIARKEIR